MNHLVRGRATVHVECRERSLGGFSAFCFMSVVPARQYNVKDEDATLSTAAVAAAAAVRVIADNMTLIVCTYTFASSFSGYTAACRGLTSFRFTSVRSGP